MSSPDDDDADPNPTHWDMEEAMARLRQPVTQDEERNSPRYFGHLEHLEGRRPSRTQSTLPTLPSITPNPHRSGQSMLLRNLNPAEHSGSYASIARTALRTRIRPPRQRPASSPREFQRTANQLDMANSNLRTLLDDPIPSITPPVPASVWTTTDSTSEAEPSRRKRRRLDKDDQPPDYSGFSYGYYGQVVPGQLRMEIVSCDGGSFESDSNRHAAENVLKDDYSVYCTKANRCNLILRHQGATPFCLDQLIIKAPLRGYTAPIQEGMVFVSMTSDDLLARTARYQIQYSSPKRLGRRSSESSTGLPPIVSIRHNGDGTTSHHSRSRLYDKDEDDDDRHAQIPSDFTVMNSANFSVTTECSEDEEEHDDEFSSPHRRRNAGRPGFRIEEGTDDDEENYDLGIEWPGRSLRRPRPQESSRRETPSQITLADAVEASQIATQEAMRAVGGEYMAAHARFFIEKDKSKCTIKFDPPISGRFVLLKMWSPRRETSKNIDIQSIVAKGYAGPRLFPAQKFL